MDKMSFGEILRNTRERKGLDLNATARRLRIRPDILAAIEDSNFSAMPPRGYARNMVNGYARYLGLNPTEITGMYLDELYAHQVESENARMRPTGIDMPSDTGRAYRTGASRSGNRRTYYERDERNAAYEDAAPTRAGRSQRRGAERLYPESRTHQARGSVLPTTNYTNFYSGPGPVGFLQANWRYLAAAIAALLILILLVSQILSCTRKEPEQVPTVPVTGVESSATTAIEQPKAPTSFTFEYTVEEGAASWIEVYVDEAIQVGEVVEGPQTRSFTSSDSIQFITANPIPVTIKIDGEPVEIEPDAEGIVNMTWHFSDILAQWLADHPGVSATSNSDAATTDGVADAADGSDAAAGTADSANAAADGAVEGGGADADTTQA